MSIICDAFLIHSRNYQENSQLLDFLTDDFGVLRVVANGIKNKKEKIQYFLKLKITIAGAGNLKKLRSWEIIDSPRYLTGENLFIMAYVNEIIAKFVPNDAINLCNDYLYLLNNLTTDKKSKQWQLRLFENELLDKIGYGLDFEYDDKLVKIDAGNSYIFIYNQGFVKNDDGINGTQLLKVAKKIMPNDKMLNFLKQINRQRIKHLLNGRELKSKKLFK